MTPAAGSIRGAVEADLPAMLEIMRENANAPQWTFDQLHEMVARGRGPVKRAVLVSDADGPLVGFAAASVLSLSGHAEAELESIAVARAHVRCGVGRALLDAVLRWAAQEGALSMRLEVRESNAAARALYARCGFVRTGVRHRYYTHPAEDAVLMERKPVD